MLRRTSAITPHSQPPRSRSRPAPQRTPTLAAQAPTSIKRSSNTSSHDKQRASLASPPQDSSSYSLAELITFLLLFLFSLFTSAYALSAFISHPLLDALHSTFDLHTISVPHVGSLQLHPIVSRGLFPAFCVCTIVALGVGMWFRKALGSRKSRSSLVVTKLRSSDNGQQSARGGGGGRGTVGNEARRGSAMMDGSSAAALMESYSANKSAAASAAALAAAAATTSSPSITSPLSASVPSPSVHSFGALDSFVSSPSAFSRASIASSSSSSFPFSAFSSSSSSSSLPPSLLFLASTKFISTMKKDEFQSLYNQIEWSVLQVGEVLMRKGERKGDGMFIVAEGSIGVYGEVEEEEEEEDEEEDRRTGSRGGTPLTDGAGAGSKYESDSKSHGVLLSQFEAGDSIGELEMIFDTPRLVTCICTRPASLIRISSALYRDFTTSHPSIAMSFVKTTLARQWRIASFVLDNFLNLPKGKEKGGVGSSVTSPSCPSSPSSPASPSFSSSRSSYSTSSFSSSSSSSSRARSRSSRYSVPSLHHFFSDADLSSLLLPSSPATKHELSPGEVLYQEGTHQLQDQLFVLVSGKVLVTRSGKRRTAAGAGGGGWGGNGAGGNRQGRESGKSGHSSDSVLESYELGPGAVLDSLSYFTDTLHHYTVRALTKSHLVYFHKNQPFDSLPSSLQSSLVSISLRVVEAMRPTLNQFTALGLKREFKRAGETLFVREGRAEDIFVVISGRVRIVSGEMQGEGGQGRKGVKREVSDAKRAAEVGGGVTDSTDAPPLSSAAAAARSASSSSSSSSASADDEQVYAESFSYSDAGPMQYGDYNAARHNRLNTRFEVARGECVGEVSFLNADGGEGGEDAFRHSSTAICIRDTELVKISRASYNCMQAQHPAVVIKFSQVVAERLQSLMRNVPGGDGGTAGAGRGDGCLSIPRSPFISTSNNAVVVALLPHSSSVNVSIFATRLTAHLSMYGSAIYLSPTLVDRQLGERTCANLNDYYFRSRFTCWLTEVEESHRFVVCEASLAEELQSWTRCCIRTADCVLVLADAKADPKVGKAEQMLLWSRGEDANETAAAAGATPLGADAAAGVPSDGSSSRFPSSSPSSSASSSSSRSKSNSKRPTSSRSQLSFCIKDLVLLHSESTVLPSSTRYWFVNRKLHSYHHIRVDLASHYDRLARYLAGNCVGLVLSGGGARGLAHLGTVRALAEQEISVDCIGGTSQGSFMSALFALQPTHSLEALELMTTRTQEMAQQLGSISSLLKDATLPMMSYFAGRRFGNSISLILGTDVRIEDLWTKFFCVSTNVSKADICVHTTGILWRAVRASMTLMDFLPPMQISSTAPDLLIDGGYINNLPCDVIRDLFQPAYVIGVDVENKDEEKFRDTAYYGDYLSGMWLLRKKVMNVIGPLFKQPHIHIPQYTDIVGSLAYINHNRNIRQFLSAGLIDLYIRPELGNTLLLDYHKVDSICEIGYRMAKVKVTEWKLMNSGGSIPVAVEEGLVGNYAKMNRGLISSGSPAEPSDALDEHIGAVSSSSFSSASSSSPSSVVPVRSSSLLVTVTTSAPNSVGNANVSPSNVLHALGTIKNAQFHRSALSANGTLASAVEKEHTSPCTPATPLARTSRAGSTSEVDLTMSQHE